MNVFFNWISNWFYFRSDEYSIDDSDSLESGENVGCWSTWFFNINCKDKNNHVILLNADWKLDLKISLVNYCIRLFFFQTHGNDDDGEFDQADFVTVLAEDTSWILKKNYINIYLRNAVPKRELLKLQTIMKTIVSEFAKHPLFNSLNSQKYQINYRNVSKINFILFVFYDFYTA